MTIALQIAEQLLKTLKSEITSATDIISRTELPFTRVDEFPMNIEKYGALRFNQYLTHLKKIEEIRTKASSLFPIYTAKGIPSPFTTIQVAITQCGIGECGETTNRATVELMTQFTERGLNIPVNMITTLGKARVPFPKNDNDYYEHGFIIIGETPTDWDYSTGLRAFRKLGPDCILLDPSLGIIGPARDTEKLLKKMFDAYEINRIAGVDTVEPNIGGVFAKDILKNAKEIASIIKRDLHLVDKPKASTSSSSVPSPASVPSPVSVSSPASVQLPSTAPMRILPKKILFDNTRSTQVRSFDNSEICSEDKLLSSFSLFRPKNIMLSEDSLTWKKSEQLYDETSLQEYTLKSY
jgi:hypothetical protein